MVIPTYGRDHVLIKTIESLLAQNTKPVELLIIDQSMQHEETTQKRLAELERSGMIRWIRRQQPSITAAMNDGMKLSQTDLVLFMDDDIRAESDLVARHAAAFAEDSNLWATVGCIIQPWQLPDTRHPRVGKLRGLRKDTDFRFNSLVDSEVENTMAGNLCVHRQRAMSIGGFDENFIGSAIQFETDFARRIVNAGGHIQFLGAARLDHLMDGKGGTRTHGGHLTCGNAMHSVGGYYYAFRNAPPIEAWWYCLQRMLRQVRTRFHLTHPWWIPVKLTGEARALMLARKLLRHGPGFCSTSSDQSNVIIPQDSV